MPPVSDPYTATAEQSDPYAATAEQEQSPPAKKPGYFTPENFQNLASEAGEREQEYLRRANYPGAAKPVVKDGKLTYEPTGEQPTTASRYGSAFMSGIEGIVRVTDQVTAGLLDPKTAIAFLVSKVSPAAAGAYFMTQSSAGAKDAGKDIAKNGWTPENSERLLLALSGIAGGATMAEGSTTPKPVGELLNGLKERAQGVARRVTEAKPGVTKAVEAAGDKYANELGENQQARREAVAQNIDKDTKAKAEIERNERDVAEKNKAIEAENKASREAVARKAELAKTVDEQSAALGKSIENVESKVYKAADERFKTVRRAIGNVEAPADNLIASVKNVEANTLQGIPENIKEFRSILRMEGEEAGPLSIGGGGEISPGEPGYEQVRQAYLDEGLLKENEPLTWDKLQSLKSRIDARLRSRGRINGDLKRGLFQVRDAIVDQMGEMAESAGAGEIWTDARNFWRQMREDFHEPTGPSGSGSPVAQALDAVDPRNIRQPFLRTQSGVGNRAIDILRKYPQYGGTEAAAQAEQMLRTQQEMQGLPKTATEKPAATVKPHKISSFKEVPEQPLPPSVNPEQVSRQKIQETAERVGRLNVWDARIVASSVIAGVLAPFLGLKGGVEIGAAYVVTKYLMSEALTKPKVVNWIAETPPSELAALQKLPQAQLVNIKGAITTAGELTKAKTISPELREFLGPENVKRILAASGAVAGSKQRKAPGEQVRDLNKYSSNPNLPVGVDQ
jgi:hypothetical protein